MELFSNDSSIEEYKQNKLSRKNFTEANLEMTDSLDMKVIDSKNIKYSDVHTSIYDQVGLGKNWRVDQKKNSKEVDKATQGFKQVTKSLEPYPDKSIWSKNIIKVIFSFFKKNNEPKSN